MNTDPESASPSDRHPPTVSFGRFVLTCVLFLLVWDITAVIVGLLMELAFPSPGDSDIGVGLTWRNLPGTVLGFFAACRTWRAMIDHHLERLSRKPNEPGNA
jgi:hypothetical protein